MHRTPAAVSVLVAAGVALGVGELAGGLVRGWVSPLQAVAEVVIDHAPTSVTRFGIETFGDDDKTVLVVTTVALLGVVAIGVGVWSRHRPRVVPAAFAALTVVGALAAWEQRGPSSGVTAVAAGGGGLAAWYVLARSARPAAGGADIGEPIAAVNDGLARRRFVVTAAVFVAVAAGAAAAGRALRSRFSAADSRERLALPGADASLPAPTTGASFDIDGLSPLYTPNDAFYRIDTALTIPQLPVEDWTLTVTGLVETEVTFDFDELCDLGLIEADITLTCVSNPVGGELVGNARWLGVPLRRILDAAGVDGNADQIVGRSADGYTCGFPVAAAYDRDAIVAVGMNGEPLPLRHGFPARLVTPGLYGYVSATKWLVEIELTRFDSFQSFWVPRGYAAHAPIKTAARVDVPRAGRPVDAGATHIAGVAWSQPDGISRVEVQVDDGPFADAELADALGDDAWRQWRHPWVATEGRHRITVRATDGRGRVQTAERAPIAPDGASGWQSVLVVVRP